jgi:hypothetical protein
MITGCTRRVKALASSLAAKRRSLRLRLIRDLEKW